MLQTTTSAHHSLCCGNIGNWHTSRNWLSCRSLHNIRNLDCTVDFDNIRRIDDSRSRDRTRNLDRIDHSVDIGVNELQIARLREDQGGKCQCRGLALWS